tara:strand:+ start:688 stop:879 length:192 start_codon:yes stop_codon:yes gene_type:complete
MNIETPYVRTRLHRNSTTELIVLEVQIVELISIEARNATYQIVVVKINAVDIWILREVAHGTR